MTPEQRRIKIAEICGWRGIIAYKMPIYTTNCVGMPSYHKKQLIGHAPNVEIGNPKRDDPIKTSIPDYLNDFNAIHEAEKVLITEDQQKEYARQLHFIGVGKHYLLRDFEAINATAPQRAEAFLKTLNLWIE